MKKLYKNKNMIALLTTTLSLAAFLNACTLSNERKKEIKKEQISQILEDKTPEKQQEKQNEKTIKLTQKTCDKEIEEYINTLKEEITDLSEYSKEQWQSEEVQEKYYNAKKKAKDLFDFVFNGKEINGISFKNLSDNGKEIAKNGFYELDEYVELLIPNYKERFYNWTVDKGADALEKYDSLKEWYNNYKKETIEEYNSRKTKSK